VYAPSKIHGYFSVVRRLETYYHSPSVLIFDRLQGADSSHGSADALEAAKALAQTSSVVVAVSGAVDFITDGKQVVSVTNGVPMMQKITATGCAVTGLIAAFVAVEPSDALIAAACALAVFGLAGEIGMESAKGPASLRMHLIDALYCLDEQTVTSRVNISM
jgi:hydroxyethylthiazole kinase